MARPGTAGANSAAGRTQLIDATAIHCNPSSALNLATAKPRLRRLISPCPGGSRDPTSPSRGPGNGILRAETGGRFWAQNAGERSEIRSQTATRLANRPKLRGLSADPETASVCSDWMVADAVLKNQSAEAEFFG